MSLPPEIEAAVSGVVTPTSKALVHAKGAGCSRVTVHRRGRTAELNSRVRPPALLTWTRADDDLYGDLAAQLDAWIAKQWETAPTWVQRRRKSVETLCHCFDCQEYGDGARRHDEVKRKIEAAKREQQSAEKDDPADAVDETMTVEVESDLKTQHEVQAQVEVLGAGQEALTAGQEALAAQVAALIRYNGNETQT